MEDQPHPRPPSRALPAFDPVPLRARRDGWTPERQREFIRILHVTRSISAACQAVGMSRKSAYRLRERPGAETFATAWDAAFALRPAPAPINFSQLWYRACFRVKPVIRGGKQVGMIEQPDNAAALKLYDRIERNCRNADRRRARRDGSGR
jgi:hypothetical protein